MDKAKKTEHEEALSDEALDNVSGGRVNIAYKPNNFEIQDWMSQYNQAQHLASRVLKNRDDTANSIIGKF
jgi:hypothetical protein